MCVCVYVLIHRDGEVIRRERRTSDRAVQTVLTFQDPVLINHTLGSSLTRRLFVDCLFKWGVLALTGLGRLVENGYITQESGT